VRDEYHSSKHAAQTPHVQRIVIISHIYQQFGSFEVSGSDSDIVLFLGVIEFCETPINKSEFPLVVVDHNIMRFDIPMHDASGMAVIEGLEKLHSIISDVEIGQGRKQLFEVSVIDIFENERIGLGDRIHDSVQQLYYVGTAHQILQNLDFTLYLFLLNRFQNLDHTWNVASYVHPFKYFAVHVLSCAPLHNRLVHAKWEYNFHNPNKIWELQHSQ